MNTLTAYILAGGKSSRFGSDKALAIVDGQPLVRRISERVRPQVSNVTVIAERKDKYADLGLRTLADLEPGLGPLGGLHTALSDVAPEGWLLLLSCDLLALEPAWLDILLQQVTPTARAVAFKPDFWQPLFALYHTSLRETVRTRLASKDRSLQSLLRDVGAIAAPLPADWPAQLQANKPQDLPKQ